MSAALLPCPFCGGPVALEKTHQSRHEIYGMRQWWGVRCTNTVNVGGTCAIEAIPAASQEAAVERWNRRAPAIAPPVAAGSVDIDDTEFRELYERFNAISGPGQDARRAWADIAGHVNAWGVQQREQGRQEEAARIRELERVRELFREI